MNSHLPETCLAHGDDGYDYFVPKRTSKPAPKRPPKPKSDLQILKEQFRRAFARTIENTPEEVYIEKAHVDLSEDHDGDKAVFVELWIHKSSLPYMRKHINVPTNISSMLSDELRHEGVRLFVYVRLRVRE